MVVSKKKLKKIMQREYIHYRNIYALTHVVLHCDFFFVDQHSSQFKQIA